MQRLIAAILVGTIALASAANAQMPIPQPNAEGDYPRTSHRLWRVADLDPAGLNCRWSEGISDPWYSPDARFPDLKIQDWAIVRRFEAGTVLTSNITPAGFAFIHDDRGLPWLKVSLDDRDAICLVRANQQFVVPIP
ncbi:MAG TPA: hypothetical protein IGS17_07960 [Oscillatoriales cyanobacterium M59_W2019_021]|nr:MAG: hypothetical protein D6728_03270 [Cyanobacteria bacterium J055]HIK30989.1 hypothetical protein [Oscillatoriales cyanobacterium M4454_W2019_049]HIK50841.1 hypothetical protein [Oscillatoriales cyanobacterium M59_W2019_021]